MKTKKILQKTFEVINFISSITVVVLFIFFHDEILKDDTTENCVENYREEIDKLKTKIYNDSITLTLIENDYYEVWEENQIFSSMLSEIENEPGGHEILQKLWGEKR